MKKPTPKLSMAILFLLAISIFNACKKDKSTPVSLIGKWVYQHPYQNTQAYQDIYQFNADSSYTQNRVIADTVSGQIIGYQATFSGKFHANADQVELYNISSKSNNNYVPFNQLINFTTPNTSLVFKYAFASNGTSFHFIFNCPVNANCLPEGPYNKK